MSASPFSKSASLFLPLGFPGGSSGKESACNVGDPWVGKIPWRRERLPTLVLWPGEFHGLYSPWGCKELDTTLGVSVAAGGTFVPSTERHAGFSRVVVQTQWLQHVGLVALRHCELLGFPTRGQTCAPCIGRWILNHWTTREVLRWEILKNG